ncbi:hypothetical protein RchiOBHm_Chr2g0138301 [Rosa chinensis]|uniref:Secreted protein n=1 Tax=Rosa chinensis TaxID=74649 RepID=A0A2P6RWV2_ROSCH|nr:hypothetical protein RchiOBHm_Chr2g0138301 [Rosa chinensis]
MFFFFFVPVISFQALQATAATCRLADLDSRTLGGWPLEHRGAEAAEQSDSLSDPGHPAICKSARLEAWNQQLSNPSPVIRSPRLRDPHRGTATAPPAHHSTSNPSGCLRHSVDRDLQKFPDLQK